ncbi:uncharacterized protein LOC104898717 [Beta vulgaris subsp. vulgaris]|uniref:uncharacterized protein LOC104898717 n=1 Tax=Beta vulgaris subsp. vulgaris TaxID=3555 RepID=UPI002036A982|nr:uncharacterized protein LOC104898717 [Beta vulgaris subsp. vulgaris]
MAIDDEVPRNSSYAFRSLFKAGCALKKGLYKKLGNGKQIRIDRDKWHPSKFLIPKMLENHVDRTNNIIMVNDLINTNKEWKANIIWKIFPPEEAKEIFAVHIPHEECEDDLEWSHTKSGRYSVKSGYWLLHQEAHIQDDKATFWKSFWKSDIFPKWKHFIWKILNNTIPSADNLIKRQIRGINPACCLCKKEMETTTHLLRDCSIAQRIWSSSMGIVASQGSHLPIQSWIRNFLNLLKKKKGEQALEMEIRFISTLWGIWVHRNEVIFKESSVNPRRIIEIINDHILRASKGKNSLKVRTRDQTSTTQEEQDAMLNWTIGDKNTPNVQTILVDGAWKKNSKSNMWQAAVAWKNANKDPKEEYAARIYASSSEQTEAYAILRAISDMEWRSAGLIIKTDNREVILALKSMNETNKSISNIIKDIKRIANSYLFVMCIKVSREDIAPAHNLAVKARKG